MLRKEISGVSFPSIECPGLGKEGGVQNQGMEASQSKKLQAGAEAWGEAKGLGLLLQKWRPASQAWCVCEKQKASSLLVAGM